MCSRSNSWLLSRHYYITAWVLCTTCAPLAQTVPILELGLFISTTHLRWSFVTASYRIVMQTDRQTDRQLNPRQNAQNCFYGSCCYSRCLKEHNMPSWHTHTHTTRTLTNFSPNPSFNITPVHTLPLNLTRTSDIMISCIRSPLGQLVLTWSVFVSEKVPNK